MTKRKIDNVDSWRSEKEKRLHKDGRELEIVVL